MATFIIGLVILFGGAALYGRFCEKVFGPDDRQTPAYAKQDGVDYIPMKGWRNSLINLLNIAGTGPILGPIQGILFGPIAFITIPIGNVIGGAMHDYFSGMICLRDGGTQMPQMIKRYSNKGIFNVYNVFCCLLLLLVGAVFVYTPGDIAATSVFGFDGKPTSVSTWIIYGVIFLYYLVATVFPIDAIIGRIYPIFGAILLFSAVGVFIGIFVKGYPLLNVWDDWSSPILQLTGADGAVKSFTYADYFKGGHFLPIFFVTVACGILSGFHSTQTAIISRTVKNERQGRMTFYNMMILEGFIAMVWAAGAMGVYNLALQEPNASLATGTIGVVCKDIRGRRHRPDRRHRSAHHLRRYRSARSASVPGGDLPPGPVHQRQAYASGHPCVCPGCRHHRVRQVQHGRLQHSVALLRMVQPDPVSVRLPVHHGVDV